MNWFNLIFESDARIAHVVLGDDIGCGGQTSGALAAELGALHPNRVEVQINSRGGDSRTALNLAEIFRRYDSHATVTGRAYSAALIAAMGCKTISALSTSKFLIHSPAGYAFGTSDALLNAAVDVEKLCSYVHGLFKERTEQPDEVISAWLAHDSYFTTEEALAAGFLDDITEPPPSRQSESQTSVPANLTGSKISESQALFQDWLAAFGEIEVQDKSQFARALQDWLNTRVHEVPREITV